MKFLAVIALAMAVAIKEEPVQEVDLATAMDQMSPEQMETMLDAADKNIPQDADLGEMPEDDEEAEESAEESEEEPEEDEELEAEDQDDDQENPDEDDDMVNEEINNAEADHPSNWGKPSPKPRPYVPGYGH